MRRPGCTASRISPITPSPSSRSGSSSGTTTTSPQRPAGSGDRRSGGPATSSEHVAGPQERLAQRTLGASRRHARGGPPSRWPRAPRACGSSAGRPDDDVIEAHGAVGVRRAVVRPRRRPRCASRCRRSPPAGAARRAAPSRAGPPRRRGRASLSATPPTTDVPSAPTPKPRRSQDSGASPISSPASAGRPPRLTSGCTGRRRCIRRASQTAERAGAWPTLGRERFLRSQPARRGRSRPASGGGSGGRARSAAPPQGLGDRSGRAARGRGDGARRRTARPQGGARRARRHGAAREDRRRERAASPGSRRRTARRPAISPPARGASAAQRLAARTALYDAARRVDPARRPARVRAAAS